MGRERDKDQDKDRGKNREGEKMGVESGYLGHERLHVYQRALGFVGWTQEVLGRLDRTVAVADHLERASESIVESLANGNSRRSTLDRRRYFDIAVGSALECAACLDVCGCKGLAGTELQADGKTQLRSIVNMTFGLREAPRPSAAETPESYGTEEDGAPHVFFAHERLEAYRAAIELVITVDRLVHEAALDDRHSARLDKACTSVVLNIAEGNGRFCHLDHRRFVDLAHTGAIGVASCLDVLVARGVIGSDAMGPSKRVLVKMVPLLLGLRGYLDARYREADDAG